MLSQYQALAPELDVSHKAERSREAKKKGAPEDAPHVTPMWSALRTLMAVGAVV